MANNVPSGSGFMVVTHVFPQQGAQSVTSPQTAVVSTPPSVLGKFLKGEPAALGTAQIIIGVVVFLFGIVTAFYASAVSTYSGIMFWGAIIYITAGSLTVRANKKLNPCLVKASLGMNIFSTISAGLAIIFHILDLTVRQYPFYGCYGYESSCYRMEAAQSRVMGIAGVMLVLSILEFIVSICVSAFACKATCTSGAEQVIYVSTTPMSAPPLNPSETPLFQSSVVPPVHYSSADGLKAGNPDDLPPEYTVTQE